MALSRLAILDTPAEDSFDRVTRLAARTLDVPIALVSLVDQTRQWFKSCVGLNASQTPREVSFCGHAIYDRETLIVADATLDPRFADNPLVTGEPHIRAYMGVPIFTSDEQPIGTLCVLDRKPRSFDEDSRAALADFAAIVQEAIRAREYIRQSDSVLQFAQSQEQLFRDSFEQAAIGMLHVSLTGLLLRTNRSACAALGYARDALHLQSVIDLTHAEDLLDASRSFRRAVAGEIDDYQIEKRVLRGDGSYLWAKFSVALRRTAAGSPDYLIATLEDISERKNNELAMSGAWDTLTQQIEVQNELLRDQGDSARRNLRELIEAESRERNAARRFRAISDNVPALIGYWNRGLRCEFANAQYVKGFGLALDQIVGKHISELFEPAVFRLIEQHALAVLGGEEQRFERRLNNADGTISYTDVRYVPDRDDTGAVRGFFSLVLDITELVTARLALESSNAKLTRESGTDFLTGLANRRTFNEHCEDSAASFLENGEHYGLVLLDLDNFKLINDRFGHEVGDRVLRAVGRVLRDEMRGASDMPARLGGEEFGILCIGDLGESGLRLLAERVRAQINRESINTVKGLVTFTASFGVAQSLPGDPSWKSIFERADAALYRAKESGKDRVLYGKSVLAGGTGRFKAMKLA